ncbi:MAG: GlsB/YeaQ/YmgE family stress response membrane protein [Polyangiaceae bacterium]
MGILLFIVFGFVVGLLARALLPGRQAMGLIATTGLGIAGSFIGGFLVSLFTHRPVTELHTAGMLGSILGAIVLLAIVSGLSRRRALV